MAYVVLVATIVDPSSNKREYTQAACAGTLVKNNLVLTAASCLVHGSVEQPSEKDTLVCIRPKEISKATKIFLHPEYTRTEERFNVAIVQIDKIQNIGVLPTLPSRDENVEDVINTGDCIIAGYGSQLRLSVANFHEMPIENNVTVLRCAAEKPMLCLHFENLLPCEGDVGSPVICKDELYALFTPKLQIDPTICLDRYGITFTQVYQLTEFIERVINIPTVNMEWMSNPLYILLLCGTVLAVIAAIYYVIMSYLQKRFEKLAGPEQPAPSVDDTEKDSESVEEQEHLRWRYNFDPYKSNK